MNSSDIYNPDRRRGSTRLARDDWEQTFDTVPDLLAILDEQYRIIRVNRAMADRLGIAPDQCTGLTCYETIHGLAEPPPYCPHTLTRQDLRTHVAEVYEPRLGGDFLVSTTPRFDQQGRMSGVVHVARDITERKQAEVHQERLLAEVVRRAAELDAAFEGTHAQVALLDRDFNFVMANSSYIAGCGHPGEDLIGHNHFALFPNEENQAIFERVRDTGEVFEVTEKPFEYADQPERGVTYWNWRLTPVKGGSGEVTGVLLSLLDVTAQVRARNRIEELAAEAQRRAAELDAAIEAIPDGISILDQDGRILIMNPAAVEMTGLNEGQRALPLAGRWRLLLVHNPDGGEVALEDMVAWRALHGEVVNGKARLLQLPGGGETHVVVSGAPIRTLDGRLLGAVLCHTNVNDLYRLQDEQKRLLTELNAIIQVLPAGLFLYDLEGRIVRTNPAADRIFGYSPEELRLPPTERQSPLEWVDEDGRPLQPADLPIQQSLAGDTPVPTTLGFRRYGQGRHVWIYVDTAPIRGSDGAPLGAVSAFVDISALKEAELIRDQFLAVAAHELKTPIAIMKGYAQLLMRSAHSVSPRDRKLLSAVSFGADRIDRLVMDLLDITQLQAGQLNLVTEGFDLRDLVESAANETAMASEKHQITVRGHGPIAVVADRGRVQQVVVNLLSNAIKYSPGGGGIDLSIASGDGEVVVSVQDQGVGIPADKQDRIFDYFYRAHGGTEHDYGGMGVGLYISREIVSRHGGRMWFESQEGEGSTFYFSLPLKSN